MIISFGLVTIRTESVIDIRHCIRKSLMVKRGFDVIRSGFNVIRAARRNGFSWVCAQYWKKHTWLAGRFDVIRQVKEEELILYATVYIHSPLSILRARFDVIRNCKYYFNVIHKWKGHVYRVFDFPPIGSRQKKSGDVFLRSSIALVPRAMKLYLRHYFQVQATGFRKKPYFMLYTLVAQNKADLRMKSLLWC